MKSLFQAPQGSPFQSLSFPERLSLLGSAFRGDTQPMQQAAQRGRQLQALEAERAQRQELGRILSGQQTPAFLRPGGAEYEPQRFQQDIRQQLGALGTPQSLEILSQLIPDPIKEREVQLEERDASLQKQLLSNLVSDTTDVATTTSAINVSQETSPSQAITLLKQRRQQLLPALVVEGASDIVKAQIRSIDEDIKFQRELAREKRKQQEKLTPESASKVSLVKVGLSQLDKIEKLLKDERGNFNNSDIIAMTAPGGGLPFTKGRQARALFLNAINAQLRAESGAAVPEQEVERAFERFAPSILDSDEAKQVKIDSLRSLLKETLATSKGSQQEEFIETGEKQVALPQYTGEEQVALPQYTWEEAEAELKSRGL